MSHFLAMHGVRAAIYIQLWRTICSIQRRIIQPASPWSDLLVSKLLLSFRHVPILVLESPTLDKMEVFFGKFIEFVLQFPHIGTLDFFHCLSGWRDFARSFPQMRFATCRRKQLHSATCPGRR